MLFWGYLCRVKKVLIITYYWPPAGGPGVQRMLKFAKYMPQFEVKPFVLTIDENHAFYPVKDNSLLKDISPEITVIKTKSAEPLKLLSRFMGKKEVPSSGFANHNKNTLASKILRFIRGNFFIPDARKSWAKRVFPEACRLIEQENVQTLIISTPPHSTQLAGLKLKEKYPHLTYIADLRDPWTDIYYYKDMLHTKWAKKLDAFYEQEVIKAANHILVVSPGIKEMFAAKYPGIALKITALPNGFDEDDFAIASNPPKGEFLISHTGTLADSYRPEVFFKAFKKLADTYSQYPVKALFVGKVSPGIRQIATDYKLGDKVTFKEYVPHEEVIKYQKNCTCLLLIIAEASNQKGLISGKIFEYLASRKPVIAIGPRHGDAEDILSYCEAGKIFSREEGDALLSYMEEKLIQWSKNSDLDMEGNKIDLYSRRNLTRQLCGFIK